MRLRATKTASASQHGGFGDVLYDAAGQLPAFDFNFAESKALKDQANGQSLLTHTRASSATYVGSNKLIQDATTNVARFDHDPVTGESLGLLVEQTRTNLIEHSEHFTGRYWASNVTLTDNAGSSPAGTQTACQLTENVVLGYHDLHFSYSVALIAKPYTYSLYVKPNGREWVKLRFSAAGTWKGVFFHLSGDGSVGHSDDSAYSAGIANAGGGWYRCHMTFTTTPGAHHASPALANGNNSLLYQGDGQSGIYVWGAQIETAIDSNNNHMGAEFPSSYIRTSGSVVTRADDVVGIEPSNFGNSSYDQTGGTMFASYKQGPVASFEYPCIFGFRENPNLNSQTTIEVHATTTGGTGLVRDNNAEQASGVYSGINIGSNVKTALVFGANDFKGVTNGSSYLTDTSGTVPNSIGQLLIGQNVGSEMLNSTISRIAYWPSRLPDGTLTAITS